MANRVKIEESVDRISSLPDSILGHILSFLSTEVAVRACILLTRSRWRDVFPLSNNLDFYESFDGLVNNPNDTRIFMDFVDRCITLMNGTSIDKFRLNCSKAVDTSRIHSWICAALRSHVRELDFHCVGMRKFGKEYSRVFTCNTLVVLKLGIGFPLIVPSSVYLPCLKILHLKSIILANKDSPIQRLVSSCPVLEDFFIEGCYMSGVPVLSLSSPSLKRLAIDQPYDYLPYKLILDTPRLVYLEFAVCMSDGHILKNLGSLCEARIYISPWLKGRIAHHELLAGLGNVHSLYLSGNVRQFIGTTMDVFEDLPLLENLTRLVITGRLCLEMSVAMKLLQYCPNLEEFVTDGSIQGGYDVPCCVSSRLKSIECELFYEAGATYHREVESLQYFLKNANMLEKMRIHVEWYSWVSSVEISKKVGSWISRYVVSDALDTLMEPLKKLGKDSSRSKGSEIIISLAEYPNDLR